MLILSRANLERLLEPLDVIGALEAAFRLAADGGAVTPPRGSLGIGEGNVLLLMPAALTGGVDGVALGAKLVSVFAGNRDRGHPTLYASYMLLDGATGRPLALMEATYLTGVRTGAASAIAARQLAPPAVRRVVCFGAGVQAA